jgi:UDP-N-acetylglucosamine 4,6-dehydratase
MMNFNNQTIAITGSTGTWGTEIIKQLLVKDVKEIIAFSRGEAAQVAMKHKFKDRRLRFVIGDVRDPDAIMQACQGVDIVLHTAALKHIDKCELQPEEATKTNIIGTQNVINACIANRVNVCVNTSTDKSADPTSYYGKTKAISEGLITAANNRTLHTDFINTRSGNILGSNGSVIPLFIKQIAEHNKITVTNPDMTRFFIPISHAIRNVFKAMDVADRGETWVFNMQSFRLGDLAEVMIDYYGNKDTKIEIVGNREAEKLHELLITDYEASNSYIYDKNLILVLPALKIDTTDYVKYHKLANKKHSKTLTSGTHVSDKKTLKVLLQEAGYCL